MWRVNTGEHVALLEDHCKFTSVVFSHDSTLLVAASSTSISILDVVTGRCVRAIEPELNIGRDIDSIERVALSQDSTLLAPILRWEKNKVQIFKTNTAECVYEWGTDTGYTSLRFLSCSTRIALLYRLGGHYSVGIWDLKTATCLNSVIISSQRSDLQSPGLGWDPMTREDGASLRTGHRSAVQIRAFFGLHSDMSRDSRLIALTVGRVSRVLRNAEDSMSLYAAAITTFWDFKISPDDDLIATTEDGHEADSTRLRMWSSAAKECLWTFTMAGGPFNWNLKFSNDSEMIALTRPIQNVFVDSGSSERTVILKAKSGQSYAQFPFYHRRLYFSMTSQIVATVSEGVIYVWKLSPQHTLSWQSRGHTDRVDDISFSNDSSSMASVCDGGPLMIWCMRTGNCLRRFDANQRGLPKLCFSSDSKLIALASSGSTSIQIWHTHTGECIRNIHTPWEEGTFKSIVRLQFSPDSKLIAKGDRKYGVRMYSVDSGELIRQSEPSIRKEHMSFQGHNTGSTRLMTESGAFTMVDVESEASLVHSAGSGRVFRRSGYGLSSDQSWVLWNDTKVLWVPEQFRRGRRALLGSSIIFGRVSEKLCFITLSYEQLPSGRKRAASPPDSPGLRVSKAECSVRRV